MTPWGEYLTAMLKARGMDQAAFARLVDEDPSYINRCIHGAPQSAAKSIFKPPLKKLRLWAERLQLDDAEREWFLDLGESEHAPERLAKRYIDAMAQLALWRQEVERMRRERNQEPR